MWLMKVSLYVGMPAGPMQNSCHHPVMQVMPVLQNVHYDTG